MNDSFSNTTAKKMSSADAKYGAHGVTVQNKLAVDDHGSDSKEMIAENERERRDRRLAWTLFAVTVLSTSYAGLVLGPAYQQFRIAETLMGFELSQHADYLSHTPTIVREALSFPLALLTILGCHEMGHYLQARRLGVDVSPPFFIPSVPPLGTFGAVIRMDVQGGLLGGSLMRVAATGPIAGMVPALIALVLGIGWSGVVILPFDVHNTMFLHGGVLVQGLERWVIGPIPAGYDVVWHPVAFAGWAGCFVTALNMLPMGQLDGGHVVYGLWPKHSKYIAYAAFALLLVGGVFYVGWWIFAALIGWVIGIAHPPMLKDGAVRDSSRWLGIFALLLFVLTIHPTPISDSGVVDMFDGIKDAWPYRPMGW